MSNSTSDATLNALVEHIQKEYHAYLVRMQDVQYDLFFLDHAHIAYREIFRNMWNKETSDNLIQAFANKGTINSLIYILRAIFHNDVTILMAMDKPNEIGLEISNTNQETHLGLAVEERVMQAINEDVNLALLMLRDIHIGSVRTLILDFLPAGVKLSRINIS
ncbi:hypothetical protein [Entomospira culicis]|uniref:Uncharacterized protein n=1 Tax=Entomospira culicis TaxID=2719989 RepID=A0A968GGB8_9SPIO|nr:hypothetical protein [Entomospira culicis]NIZ19087.1 hypothetical protein [Entomospira culicis]NIZ69301.1 hypothetical protein [Entomospira culicis]WDI37887.1 hypothetical protein PVA46_03620 [Entomospira culicis]WDI39514.1 hypothetical protein PVA47_03620 [Entomospira culicis]